MAEIKVEENKVCSSNSSSSNWAGLYDDLLILTIEKLDSLSDLIRFSSLCKPWNSKALTQKQKIMSLANHQPPSCILINAMDTGSSIRQRKRSLYNFTNGSQILDNFDLCIPCEDEHSDCFGYCFGYCFGSSYGWLLCGDIRKCVIVILDPLSGKVIHLPPISISGNLVNSVKDIEHIMLSSDPYWGPFEVLATYSNYSHYVVAHLRFGDESWTYSENIRRIRFDSFTFYQNHIFCVSTWGKILFWDIVHSSNESYRSIKIKEITPKVTDYAHELSTLVKTTNDDLLVVHKYSSSMKYKIFKIICSNKQFDIIPVDNLDGHSLFLKKNGLYSNHCISVLASNFSGCRANSIYYYKWSAGRVEGSTLKFTIEEFNLDDQRLKTNEQSFPINNEIRHIYSTFWVVPSIKNTSL